LFLLLPGVLIERKICINEVMSSNETILKDEDGDFPDWIELYNRGDSLSNLEGYGISDDKQNLKKWVFPKISLLPNEHLLFFASGKDRLITINHWETVIIKGDQWNYTQGSNTISADWISLNFDDSNWLSGPSGFGYGDNDDATIIDGLISVYVRKKFEIEDTTAVLDAILHVDYDGVFVAYLNGREIARSNVGISGTPVNYNQFADGDQEAVMYLGNSPEKFEIGFVKPYLRNGENILCIEVHNKSENSSDMSLIPFLSLGLSNIPQEALDSVPILGFKSSLFHTNFKINNAGESIYLTSLDGQIIDSARVKNIPTDNSFGRKPDGGADRSLFNKPTPEEVNDSSGHLLISSIPEFSHTRGFYRNPFYLTLTVDSADTHIRYTKDCSKPVRNNGTLYTEPIYITGITTIRAVAYTDSTRRSEVRTHSFVFPVDVLTQDDSGLPQEEHAGDHVFWTEEFDMDDVDCTEEEMINALMDLPTIFISVSRDSIFGIAGIHRGQNLEEYGGDPHDPD